jgi:hypothetical protein
LDATFLHAFSTLSGDLVSFGHVMLDMNEERIAKSGTALHITMPKKSWTSKQQLDWLFAQLPDFRIAQEARTTPSFFTKIYQEFHAQWPLSPLTANELAADDGNTELAQTTKEKASESVSNGFLYTNY